MTHDQLAAIFAEWDRRYREEPETFMSEVRHLLGETPASYGELAASYFEVLREAIDNLETPAP